jgi:mRNA interferase MazF
MVIRKKAVTKYTPKRGDICYVSFDPSLGHEQRGRRPALVISNTNNTNVSGMALLCPISTQIKGYPFEVRVETEKTNGVVLVDQIKALDIMHRAVEYFDTAPASVVEKVRTLLDRLTSE